MAYAWSLDLKGKATTGFGRLCSNLHIPCGLFTLLHTHLLTHNIHAQSIYIKHASCTYIAHIYYAHTHPIHIKAYRYWFTRISYTHNIHTSYIHQGPQISICPSTHTSCIYNIHISYTYTHHTHTKAHRYLSTFTLCDMRKLTPCLQ